MKNRRLRLASVILTALLLSAAYLLCVPAKAAYEEDGTAQDEVVCEYDVEILAWYIYKVCKTRDYITMLCVGSAVCNRVKSPAFADSVPRVVAAMSVPRESGTELFYRLFSDRDPELVFRNCRRAAYEACCGCAPAGDILYFTAAGDGSFSNREPAAEYGGLTFYK